MAIATIAGAVAAKKALERVVEDAYELGKGKMEEKLKRWRAKSTIQTLYKKISHVRKVKTIWQAEKEVDLQKFYYPSKVKIGDKGKVINQVEDLEYEGNIIIEGKIGQGKSIFFRYLTSQEMVKGNAIPLFVELRRIRENEALIDHLVDEVESLGLEVDQKTLLFLAQHGKLILFLDAFDEVKENRRGALINEIERLTKRYDKLRILISSRPDSGITASPFFRVFQQCPLGDGEYKNVVGHMVKDPKAALEIVKGIEHSKKGIEGLLTTPLMVALLVVRYRVEQTIPENAIAFYDGLFNLLLVRHDKTKAGYIRPRKSKLGETALRKVFNGICFITRKENKGVLDINDLKKHVEEAIRIAGYDVEVDKLLDDIMDITCLILEEGGECKFIHKSLQEYHAACFIKDQPDESAAKFYKGACRRWLNWEQELEFLSEIDRYRYRKFFLIPDILQTLKLEKNSVTSKWEPSREHEQSLIDITTIAFEKLPNRRLCRITTQVPDYWSFQRIARAGFVDGLFRVDYFSFTEAISKKGSALASKLKIQGEISEVKLADVVAAGFMVAEISKIANAAFVTTHRELLEAQQYVEHVEAMKSLFDLQ